MNKLKNRYIGLSLTMAALSTLATGCSNDDNWQPGPDTNPGCMTMYFGQMPTYNIILEPDDSRLIPVTVGRANTQEAATIDIIAEECPVGAVIPTTVTFAPDQQETTIYVDLENMPPKSRGTVKIGFADEVTSPYGAGTATLSFNVTVSGAWVPVANDAVLSCINFSTQEKIYPDMTTALYNLDGTDNFKLTDFMNSGVDFVFTMVTPGNGWTYIKPTKNYVDCNDAYNDFGWGKPSDEGWFLYDDTNDEYPYWSPDGATYPEISYIEFAYNYSYMQLIYDDDNHGYMTFSGPYLYGIARYVTINVDFTTTFTPYIN